MADTKTAMDGTPIDHRQDFTNMQWYLANAGSTVHFAKYTRRLLSRAEVLAMMQKGLSRAPDLVRGESVAGGYHHATLPDALDKCLDYQEVGDLDFDLDDWLTRQKPKLADTGLPACRAWYLASAKPDASGNCGLLVFMTTHALAEGSDLGLILRSSDVRRPDMTTQAPLPGILRRVGMRLIVPFAAALHILIARLDRKKINEFRHVSIVLDTEDVKNTSRDLGVGRKSLLFALVLHSLLPKIAAGKREYIAYSTLPKQRIAVELDRYLKVQMQALLVKGDTDFQSFAKSLDTVLERQERSGVFTQHFFNKVLVFQRALYRIAPFLYPGDFFGSASYAMVLSLLPPVRPGPEFSDLADGPIFGGSRTALLSNCIFVPGREYLTLNLWLHESCVNELPRLVERLEVLGIARHSIQAAALWLADPDGENAGKSGRKPRAAARRARELT